MVVGIKDEPPELAPGGGKLIVEVPLNELVVLVGTKLLVAVFYPGFGRVPVKFVLVVTGGGTKSVFSGPTG